MQYHVRSQLLGAAATSQMLYGLWSSGCCGAQQTEGLLLSLQKGLQDVTAWRVPPCRKEGCWWALPCGQGLNIVSMWWSLRELENEGNVYFPHCS